MTLLELVCHLQETPKEKIYDIYHVDPKTAWTIYSVQIWWDNIYTGAGWYSFVNVWAPTHKEAEAYAIKRWSALPENSNKKAHEVRAYPDVHYCYEYKRAWHV